MNVEKEIGADPRHLSKLVTGIMEKLTPVQLAKSYALYKKAVSKMAEFFSVTGFQYEPSFSVSSKFQDTFHNIFTRWVLEEAKDEWNGYFTPLRWSLELPPWAIVAKQMSIPVEFKPELMPVFDFEFRHYDYSNELGYNSPFQPFPTLDLIYAGELYGFSERLRKGSPNNTHNRRCAPRPTRKATRSDIRRHAKGDNRELAYAILEHPDGGIDMTFMSKDGIMFYLLKKPSPPRRAHRLDEIKKTLENDVTHEANENCRNGNYADATNLLCRRNRVKGFLGSDVKVPKQLAEYHRDSFGKFRLDDLREKVRRMVGSYSPSSLSYGLDIPENFTPSEYSFFRYMETFIDLSRNGTLLYDNPEKQVDLRGTDFRTIPLNALKMGYKEAKSYDR